MSKKAKLIILLNSFVSLILGGFIYVFLKKGTYISGFLQSIRVDFYFRTPENLFFSLLKNWACDFLWAYSLAFLMYFILRKFKNGLALSSALTLSLGIIMELLQKTAFVSGTFDLLDLAAEAFAVILSIIIIKGVQKNEKV